MSDSGNYDIFAGMAGFVKGLETFCNAISKAMTWYEENANVISSYLLVFVEFGEWVVATNKLIENQYVFTDNLILSRLVDTCISKISLTMLPVPKPHNTACVLSWEEARRWQSRSSGYSSS